MNLPNTYLTLNDLKCYFFMKYVINYFWIASFLFDSDDLKGVSKVQASRRSPVPWPFIFYFYFKRENALFKEKK